MKFKTALIVLGTLLVLGGAVYFFAQKSKSAAVVEAPIIASYQCNGGKTIAATFLKGETKQPASPNEPPIPGGSVNLILSDGRTLQLPQTISADGGRYANADESFVFWSKGNGALVLENNQEKSYIGCIVVAPNPGNLSEIYESGAAGFSIRYPAGFALDTNYRYQEMGPGKEINGTKFTIAPTVAAGTNLAADSYVSVEEIPQTRDCQATLFLDHQSGVKAESLSDNGTDYSVASSTGAGAGNRYEETVYAIPGTNPCMALRYFIHYGVIENYPPGKVHEFDKQTLLAEFDSIRRTLIIGQ